MKINKPNITEGEWQSMSFMGENGKIESICIDTGVDADKIICLIENSELYEDEIKENAKAISAVPNMVKALLLVDRDLEDESYPLLSIEAMQAVADCIKKLGLTHQKIEPKQTEDK